MFSRSSFWTQGVPFVWGAGSMVMLILLLLAGLLGLIFVHGLSHFWPSRLAQVEVADGSAYLGRVVEHESARKGESGHQGRTRYEIGGRDVYGLDFKWLDDADVTISHPDSALALERLTDGNLFGFLEGFETDAGAYQGTRDSLWANWRRAVEQARDDLERIEQFEARIANAFVPLNDAERRAQAAANPAQLASPGGPDRLRELESRRDEIKLVVAQRTSPLYDSISALRSLDAMRLTTVRLADGNIAKIKSSHVVRVYRPNRMSFWARTGHFLSGCAAFLTSWPREANTGGGILPALLGTVLMVLLMTVAVVPLGVVAALYLHEYATDSLLVRVVRLAVSNLAGVPSIVFGVFGLGFFVYFLGSGVDRLFFAEYLPSPTFGTGGLLWASLTLALLTVPVVIVATEEGLAAVPRAYRDGSLALGANRFQTLRKIVVPHAMPGILTGVILAVSRGAGEVAPLMLTGVVPLVSDHPVDGLFPFLHLERKFMHLGFHIYDVGFQSPNVEAAKPIVYSTTLVLILLVVLLNALAIIMRNRLRKRARGASV